MQCSELPSIALIYIFFPCISSVQYINVEYIQIQFPSNQAGSPAASSPFT